MYIWISWRDPCSPHNTMGIGGVRCVDRYDFDCVADAAVQQWRESTEIREHRMKVHSVRPATEHEIRDYQAWYFCRGPVCEARIIHEHPQRQHECGC